MKTQKLNRALAIAAVGSMALTVSSLAITADLAGKRVKANAVGSMGPVPKAQCGRWDWTESGLQGQTTNWERFSGDSEGGYNCNLELVGQVNVEGTFSQDGPAYYGHCAYIGTENRPLQQHPGVIVIDASDPDHEEKKEVVHGVLSEIGAGNHPRLIVYNKADLLVGEDALVRRTSESLLVSAVTGENLDLLVDEIVSRVPHPAAVPR